MDTNDRIAAYYKDAFDETARHRDPFGRIQELRTKELIGRYLTRAGMNVLDVGGADGIYSFHLTGRGHRVTLLDIAPNHIESAKKKNDTREHKLQEIILGDARTFKTENRYDVIILHGPLYHLTKRAERIDVLRRIKDLLAPEGTVLGFGVNRYAGYFYGVRSGRLLDAEYGTMVRNEMRTGIRTQNPGWYFHTPAELAAEFTEAGLTPVAIKSVTSQIWMVPDIEDKLRDPKSLEVIMEWARTTEDHAEIGQDLMCAGT